MLKFFIKKKKKKQHLVCKEEIFVKEDEEYFRILWRLIFLIFQKCNLQSIDDH
jgi:hypothetical protein